VRIRALSRKTETPHPLVVSLNADEFRMGPRYENLRSHGTSDWLVIVTVGGAGVVGGREGEMVVVPGTVTLYPPGAFQRYGTDPRTGHWHLLWSHFHPRPHWGPWLNWPERMKGLRAVSVADPAVFRKVREAMRDAIRFSRQQLPSSMDLALNALERAVLWMHSANDHAVLDERVRRAVDLLTEKFREPIGLARLAHDCGLSVSRLAHLFRDQVGVPPQQFLEDVRLQRAALLLRATNLRIGEVADSVGYADAFYLSSRFRKAFGQSPSDYRNQGERTDAPHPRRREQLTEDVRSSRPATGLSRNGGKQ